MFTYFFRAIGAVLGAVTGASIIIGILSGITAVYKKDKDPPIQ